MRRLLPIFVPALTCLVSASAAAQGGGSSSGSIHGLPYTITYRHPASDAAPPVVKLLVMFRPAVTHRPHADPARRAEFGQRTREARNRAESRGRQWFGGTQEGLVYGVEFDERIAFSVSRPTFVLDSLVVPPGGDSALIVLVDRIDSVGGAPVIAGREVVDGRLRAGVFGRTWRSGDTTFMLSAPRDYSVADTIVARSARALAFVMRNVEANAPAGGRRIATGPSANVQRIAADAGEAFARNDYHTAYRLYRIAADSGDRRAQYWLGYFYREGTGVPRDYAASLQWYRAAADSGDPSAPWELANAYLAGHGGKPDPAAAARWFRESADGGNAAAQYMLGTLYERGHGVKRDLTEAVRWYRMATARGNRYAPAALTRLGAPVFDTARTAEGAPGGAMEVVARRGSGAVMRLSRESIEVVPIDVPGPLGPGQCRNTSIAGGTGRRLTMMYPDSLAPTVQATLTVAADGRIGTYSERRGATLRLGPTTDPAMPLEDRIAAAERANRTTDIYLDYIAGTATISNTGGGRPNQMAMVSLADAANHPRLGAPGRRAEEMLARCPGAR